MQSGLFFTVCCPQKFDKKTLDFYSYFCSFSMNNFAFEICIILTNQLFDSQFCAIGFPQRLCATTASSNQLRQKVQIRIIRLLNELITDLFCCLKIQTLCSFSYKICLANRTFNVLVFQVEGLRFSSIGKFEKRPQRFFERRCIAQAQTRRYGTRHKLLNASKNYTATKFFLTKNCGSLKAQSSQLHGRWINANLFDNILSASTSLN